MWTEYFTAKGGNMDKIKWKLFKISNKIYILAHLDAQTGTQLWKTAKQMKVTRSGRTSPNSRNNRNTKY